MKCSCSRSTCGIYIGSLYALGSLICLVLNVVYYIEWNENYEEPARAEYHKAEAIKAMIIFPIMLLLSALFIVAIVKKYHYLILPWLLALIYVFYITCVALYWWFIVARMDRYSFEVFLLMLLTAVSLIVGEIAVFSFSISLFRQMHMEKSVQQSESVRVDQQLADKSLI